MKKRNLMIMAVMAIISSVTMTSKAESIVMPFQEDGNVKCCCSLGNGTGCRADYWGSRCAPEGADDSTRYDRNCSNTGGGGAR